MITAKVVKYPIERLRQDLINACQTEHAMTVPEFVRAFDSGQIDNHQYGNREIRSQIRTLPDDDPVFKDNPGIKGETVAHVIPPRNKRACG